MGYTRAEHEEDLGVGKGRVCEVRLLAATRRAPPAHCRLTCARITRRVLPAGVVPQCVRVCSGVPQLATNVDGARVVPPEAGRVRGVAVEGEKGAARRRDITLRAVRHHRPRQLG